MSKFASRGLVSSKPSSSYEMAPEGLHKARCFQVIDLGWQETGFTDDNGDPVTQVKILIGWEILGGATREDGKPFIVTAEYTNSLSEKGKLRPILEQWRNKAFTAEELEEFQLTNVLGAYCQLQVMHKLNKAGDRKYAIVNACLPLDKAESKTLTPVNDNIAFSLTKEAWDQEEFEKLPEFIQNKIKESQTYKYEIKKMSLEEAGDEHKAASSLNIEDEEPINLEDIPF